MGQAGLQGQDAEAERNGDSNGRFLTQECYEMVRQKRYRYAAISSFTAWRTEASKEERARSSLFRPFNLHLLAPQLLGAEQEEEPEEHRGQKGKKKC